MSIGKWVGVSTDEDHHKKHSHKHTSRKSSSTSHKCLMAKGKNENDVCDDDALSHNELEQVARLFCENKSLKAQLACSSTKYEELVFKFDMVLDHNDELTKKIEALELKATSSDAFTLSFEKSIMDASTSCFDLIDKPHSPLCKRFVSWYEETCREEVAIENEVLKQKVDWLMKDVARLQGQREQAQPSQDNRPKVVTKVVTKLEESKIVACFLCNKEGHKSYMCRSKSKEEAKKREGKQKKSVTPKEPQSHKG
ncbi:hypothetical protein U9M48_024995 [Paspalum notatum var. saurae]|uniref:CCHC-type domain-containing protein n=1 Tax=Paspalum notatum var. saurae TaxID=547442 RepID=A0AAQ3TRR9_PASNO